MSSKLDGLNTSRPDAAVAHIALVLRTVDPKKANRIAGPNAKTHAFSYLDSLRVMTGRDVQQCEELRSELNRLHAAYEALLHTPDAEGYQAWTLAEKLLSLALRYADALERNGRPS